MDPGPPPPYEPPSGPGDSDSTDDITDDGTDVSFDENAPSVNWAGNHLLDARTALASYSFATRTLRRQVLEEVEVIRLGIEHHGPPPAYPPRTVVTTVRNSAYVTDWVPSCSIFGPGNIEAQLDDAIRHDGFGRDKLMPCAPPRNDPLRDAFGGVQTTAVRNPSIQWGAMVPRHHFPGAEVEGVIPEMLSTPEYVVLRRHVCDTQCPDDCHEGGGVRIKGKGRAVSEVADVDGGEEMEGVVYAHWGDDSFDESEDSGSDQEEIRDQQELETIETLEHCTIIDRHRRKWAAEIGALTYKARITTDRLPAISLNTIEREPELDYEDPTLVVTASMVARMDDQRNRADELRQEKARLARIRIAKWRAKMMGRDTTEMGDEEGEAVFKALVDSGDLSGQEIDPDNEECEGSCEEAPTGDNGVGTPGPAPRSPVKEDSAIDDNGGSSAVTEKPPTGNPDEAMPLEDNRPTIKSTEEVVFDLADEEGNKLQEAGPQEDIPEELRSLEATSQETAVEESIAQALIAQAAIARDATTPDPDLEDAPMLEPAPQEVSSGETAPGGATSPDPNPEDTPMLEPPPQEATSGEGESAPEGSITPVPNLEETPMLGSAPQETTSGETAPEDATTDRSTSKDASTGDATSERSASKKASPGDATSERSASKEATPENTTTEKATAAGTSTQGNLGPGPGPSRKRPAPEKSSLKRRPAKRQSIRESPFLDPSEREKPPLWVLQRDGRLVRNPLADSNSGPQAGRRWSDPHIGAPVPRPPSDSEPRPRSSTVSEGTELPVPRWVTGELPTMGDEGQTIQHIEEADDSPALPSPDEWALADRESMPPPPSPRPRSRSLVDLEGSPYSSRPWSPDDLFPSIEGMSQTTERFTSGGDSAADVTSLAPARDVTPEPPQMSRDEIRSSARTLSTLLEPARIRFGDPYIGLGVSRTDPRVAESIIPHRPARPSLLRSEVLVDDVFEAMEQEGGAFAHRFLIPLPSNMGNTSSASTENPSPASQSVFSSETSGRSSETTSVTVTPTGSTDVIQGGGSHLPREGSTGVEGSMGREVSTESEVSIGRETSVGRSGSITSEVAETLGGLVVETPSERVGEGSGADRGSEVQERVLPSTEVPEEAIEDDGNGSPLTRVTSHSSTRSL